MEVVTIAAGLVALSLVRFPLILAPVAFVAWYLSMDLAPVLFGSDVTDDERAAVSIAVGLVLVGLGLALDARAARRYAFWLHLFGLLTLLGSLCWFTFEHNTPLTWAVVTAISVVATLAAVPLARSTFAVFGGLGLVASLSYWSYELFEGSPAFPVAVTAIGLAFIGLGMAWYARAEQWGGAARRRLPRLGSVRRSG